MSRATQWRVARIFVESRGRPAMRPTLSLMLQMVGGFAAMPRCVEMKTGIVMRHVSLSRLV